MTRLVVILLSISLLACHLKQEVSIHHKLYVTAKVWGFLKYYHPVVNQGKLNWDQELIRIMKKLPEVKSKEELSAVFIHWIDSLGPVATVSLLYDTSHSFNKNFNLTWLEKDLLTKELGQKLRYIEQNRSQQHHYVKEGYVKQAEIIHEPAYTAAQWSDSTIRLLTLFRYWNVIDYFYPYKYKMDKKWDDQLLYFIPKFMEVKTELDYQLLIRELTVSLNDSHAFFSTDLIRNYAGKKYIPAQFCILDDKAVINGFYDDSLARLDDIQLGDAITAVNNIPISTLYQKNEKYINGSNEAVKKLRYSFRWIFNGSTDSVNITFERNGVESNKTIRRYEFSTFQSDDTAVKWKKIDPSIAYVNMEEIMAEDLTTLMKEVKDTKALIFDFRNYPEFIIDELLAYLNPAPKDFAKFIHPDLTYPGRFRWSEPVQCGSNNASPYAGKVMILVNHDTQSRSEYFVMAMQTIDGAITIGRQTSGADGDVVDFTFFDDKTSWITGNGVFYPDGRETQRTGIAIDIEVPLTIEDITKGRDAILEKAIEVARQ